MSPLEHHLTMSSSFPILNLLAIVTEKSGTFISNGDQPSYGTASLTCYLFDGAKPEATHHPAWYKIAAVPVKIQRVVPASTKTVGFFLRAGFAPSERMPAKIDLTSLSDTQYEGVSECYVRAMEMIPESLIDVECKLHVVAEREQWQPIKTEFEPKYSLLDQIAIHPILLPERPCKLTVEQSYQIIREHIKRHIQRDHAIISSDYDFCLTVKKVIQLAENEPYQITGGTKRRPTKETRYRTDRDVVVFETAPKQYQSYTVTTPFIGTSYEDLQANIKSFLDDLMARINEPVKDCPHCKGRGVIT